MPQLFRYLYGFIQNTFWDGMNLYFQFIFSLLILFRFIELLFEEKKYPGSDKVLVSSVVDPEIISM